MMAKAEVNGRSWSSIGIDDWIQAGKWWLMKVRTDSSNKFLDNTGN
jgi:hypothetical protein